MKITDAKKLANLIDQYLVEVEYSDFEEEERFLFEDVIVPIRLYLERFPEYLPKLEKGDKRIVEEFRKLPEESLLKEILTPLYPFLLKNLS
ncbi:MAG: hypothetical protein ABGW77_02665 [Campylobacterales bacterium]